MDSTPVENRLSRVVRVTLVVMTLVLLGGGLLAFRSMNLAEAAWLPKCVYHQLTGWHCPGCGFTRAMQALVQGNIPQAFAYNALWPLVMLMLVPYLARKTWYWMLGTRPAAVKSGTRHYVVIGATLGVIVLVFAVLRNLPYEPWCLLAPHELP
jgi:hypothetical protein